MKHITVQMIETNEALYYIARKGVSCCAIGSQVIEDGKVVHSQHC